MDTFYNNKKKSRPDTPPDPLEDVFGEPLSVYTKDQALEDGVLFDAGRLLNRDIVLTTNLLTTLEKQAIVLALITGLSKAMTFHRPDLASYLIAGKKIFVDDTGKTITIMLAEDY